MNTDPLDHGVVSQNFTGVGTITRGMVRERAIELAAINGRMPHETSQADLEQARRELRGEPDIDPRQALLEEVSESHRWDELPGLTPPLSPGQPGPGEDERSLAETLVDQGVQEAEHDQMLQAVRADVPRGT